MVISHNSVAVPEELHLPVEDAQIPQESMAEHHGLAISTIGVLVIQIGPVH
jgi:hypothetical protein